MGLSRIDIINKINAYSLNSNKNGLIELLCELVDNDENIKENLDLISIIIEIGELYGYGEYLKKYSYEGVDNFGGLLRLKMYESNYNPEFVFNSGQLSLVEEINLNNKVFVSAPTSFGKTTLVFETIFNNKDKYNNICIIVPTNALEEELFYKFLIFNKSINKKYKILTTPHNVKENSIFILTPEKYLMLNENSTINFDLIVIDESYKIELSEDEKKEFNNLDTLNTRSSKYRMVFELIAKSKSKVIFLSPYTYNKSDSMCAFFKKYNIVSIDRTYNYVQHQIEDISTQTKARKIFNTKDIFYNSETAGVIKAISILPFLNENTIIYIRYPAELKKILHLINNDILDKIKSNLRFNSFYNHLQNNYIFDDSSWYVLDALRKGVGLYISPMPRYIKKEIIRLFNNGDIKILIVTTAFAEGVNSTAKNIIITNETAGSNKRMTDLDILNLGGRAGRFGKYSKGYIYATKNDISDRLKESERNGVTISNSNYDFPLNNKLRSDYEIDIIDDEWLTIDERNLKNEIEKRMQQYELTDDDLNIALCTSRKTKLDLYQYFFDSKSFEKNSQRYQNICNLLSNDRNDVIKSLKNVFDEIKNSGIIIYNEPGEIPAYNKKDEFIWGIFYGIHSSGNIRDILKRRKNYILNEYNKIVSNSLKLNSKEIERLLEINNKMWINEFLSDGKIDDFKLYDNAFKFIANIIEYRIPFYIGLYVSVFKLFAKKNNLDFNFDFDVVEISASLENKNLGEKYNDMIEFGLPIDTIKKIAQTGKNEDIKLDEYEKIMLDEYNNLYSS